MLTVPSMPNGHARSSALSERTLFLAVFLGMMLGHLFLIWTVRIFPFIDLPDHLATAAIIRHAGEANNRLDQYYTVGSFFLRPNLFHILFCSAKLFPSVELANRFYYSLYVILLPLSVLLLTVRVGGDPWHALLAFPLTYSLSVSWGFSGFTLSIPVILLSFAVIMAYLQRPTWLLAGALGALFILLFFLHALSTVFLLSAYAVCCMWHHRSAWKSLAGSLAVTMPVLTVIACWWTSREISAEAGPDFVGSLVNYYASRYVSSIPDRLRFFVFDNYFLYEGLWGCGAAAAFAGVIGLPLWPWIIRPWATISLLAAARRSAAMPVGVLLVWSLVCFLSLPGEIFNFQILYPRFSVFALLAAVILGSLAPPWRGRGTMRCIICLACVVHLGLWSEYFRAFELENAAFERGFFPADARDRTLAGLLYDIRFRGKPVYFHFPSYYIVWTKGAATFRIPDLVDFAPPVRRKPGGRPIPRFKEWAWGSRTFDARYADADYLLVRGQPAAGTDPVSGEFHLIRTGGMWELYEHRPLPESHRPNKVFVHPAAVENPQVKRREDGRREDRK